MAGGYLDQSVVPYGVDVPVEAQSEQGGEQAAEQHATGQVVAQWETLSKYPTGNSTGSRVNARPPTPAPCGSVAWTPT